MASSITSGEEAFRKAESLMQSNLLAFRLAPDYESAGPLFERASVLFKVRRRSQCAKSAYREPRARAAGSAAADAPELVPTPLTTPTPPPRHPHPKTTHRTPKTSRAPSRRSSAPPSAKRK
jgi:hypothetical protein